MSHRQRRTLDQLFSHPIATDIRWNDVVRLLESLGASVEAVHGDREKVTLNGQEETFRIPRKKTLDRKDDVLQIRHFLERAGVGPGGPDAVEC